MQHTVSFKTKINPLSSGSCSDAKHNENRNVNSQSFPKSQHHFEGILYLGLHLCGSGGVLKAKFLIK